MPKWPPTLVPIQERFFKTQVHMPTTDILVHNDNTKMHSYVWAFCSAYTNLAVNTPLCRHLGVLHFPIGLQKNELGRYSLMYEYFLHGQWVGMRREQWFCSSCHCVGSFSLFISLKKNQPIILCPITNVKITTLAHNFIIYSYNPY